MELSTWLRVAATLQIAVVNLTPNKLARRQTTRQPTQ
jgi:hypothetical protein